MTVLANATLVLPGETLRGSLRIAGGHIDAMAEGRAVPPGAEDCGGDLVMPGLVELHTDNLERHIAPRPGVDWPHPAAIVAHDAELAGVGITTVFDAMRVGSVVSESRPDSREYARGLATDMLRLRGRGALRIAHFLHLRAEICSETLSEELDGFGPEDRVGLLSLMDHTPGARQFRDLDKLKDYLCDKQGLPEEHFASHVAAQKALRDRVGAAHEARAVAAARRLGAVLASHDDTTAEHVTASARHGVRIAEFPTTKEAAAACRAAGIAVMGGAPNLIRGGSHSGNIAAAELAEAGLLDILSSDYVPSALLAGALRLGERWGDLARGVATVTRLPARAVGLTDRGRLEEGARADLVRVARFGATPVVRAACVAGHRAA